MDMSAVPVKEERQDEAEIRELALKIAEAQRQRMLAPPRSANPMTNSTAPGMTILNYFNRKTKEGDTPPQATPAEPQNPAGRMDEESFRGRFGWFTLGKNHIPFILRTSERYVSVRMLELKVLQKYLTFLHQDVYNCTSIRSFYITDLEARLLNEINIRHCDYQFGKDQYTVRDLIVRLTDSVEFYNFLEVCYNKLVNGSSNPIGRCGFIRINKESVVPYTVYNLEKYVPLFYFEGETENLKTKADQLEGWDLAYLKFCCKVQGIRNELFASDSCAVISLHDIKNYFPPGTLFEDYWPSKVVDNHLLINRKNLPPAGQWTRQPQFVPTRPPPSPKPTIQTKPPMNHHPNVQTLNYTNYGIAGTQPVHPNLQSRTATSTMRPTYTSTAATTRNHSRGPPYYNLNQTQGPPPPLIRPLQQFYFNPYHPSYRSFKDTDWGSAYNSIPPSGVHHNFVMMDSMGQPPGYRRTVPQMQRDNYAPPPLIPVQHLNGSMRYEPPHTPQPPRTPQPSLTPQPPHTPQPSHTPQPQIFGGDVVDLSSASQMVHQQPLINQQPAHQQPLCSQQDILDDRNTMGNGRVLMNSLLKKLIPIAEVPTGGNHIPYKMQKALIENKLVPCLNMKPFIYTDLLVAIPDLVEQLFNVPVNSCHHVMAILGINRYRGNSAQMRLLYENGRCSSVNDIIPLVPVEQVIQYMPQLRYMLGSFNSNLMSKHQRTS